MECKLIPSFIFFIKYICENSISCFSCCCQGSQTISWDFRKSADVLYTQRALSRCVDTRLPILVVLTHPLSEVMAPLRLLLLLPLMEASRLPQEERVDCQPGEPGDSSICAARGCLWDPVGLERGVPFCYLPPEYGYRADKEAEPTAQGSRVHLTRNTVRKSALLFSL